MTFFSQQSRRGLCLAVVVLAQWFSGTTGSQSLYSLGGFELVSEQRITRTVSQYTYRATLTNGGAALGGATATATSVSARTTIVDGSVSFGAIGAGASRTSTDTFSFRHDRTAPFAWANLSWQVTPVVYSPALGVVLLGNPGAPALDALGTADGPTPAQEDVEGDIILTRLTMGIRGDSTVGQVNDALALIGGGIVTMRPGLPVVTVAVPRQPTIAAVQALSDAFASMPGIRFALPGRVLEDVQVAPPSPAGDDENFDYLQIQRFPAAWNLNDVSDCTPRIPVVVPDGYSRPGPGPSFEEQVPGVTHLGAGSVTGEAGLHGYDVLTTMAAALDSTPPTGANPYAYCLDLRAVQVATPVPWLDSLLAIRSAIPTSGNALFNYSRGFKDDCSTNPCTPETLQVVSAFERAVASATTRAVLRPYQDRVLIVQAAGNSADKHASSIYPGAGLAAYSSQFAIAATSDPRMTWVTEPTLWAPACSVEPCFDSLAATLYERATLDGLLEDLGEFDGPALANVVIVGSADRSNAPGRSSFSEPGVDIYSPGELIPAIGGRRIHGSSFAAPQVTGLASYLLLVLPDLVRNTSGQVPLVQQAILANARLFGQTRLTDAYATVLSMDPVGEPEPSTWIFRKKVLDPDYDGQFTDTDLAAFVVRYFSDPDNNVTEKPTVPDYSRYDLNGDGFTGGADRRFDDTQVEVLRTAPFDLDRTGSVQFGTSTLTTLTLDLATSQRSIDESATTDLDILCFYAYSPLYQGSVEVRDAMLANKCVELDVVVTPTGATVAPEGEVAFTADVRGTTDPRVTWSLPDGGGTISDAGVFTAGTAAGSFRVRATSVVDTDRFAEATVAVDEEEEDPIPPGTYAGTIVQRYSNSLASGPYIEWEVRWNVRMTTTRSASQPNVSGTATYRRVTYDYFQADSDSPACLVAIHTREGELTITSYSGSYNGNNPAYWGLGGYYNAFGQVTSTTERKDCSGATTSTSEPVLYPDGVSTSGSLGNYIVPTYPTLVTDADGKVTALIWNFSSTVGSRTDSVTGQVTLYP